MPDILKVFIGFDPRQAVSLAVLSQSIYRLSSKPVAITPLVIEQLPLKRTGLTPFTFSRFLVPYLCDYDGWGLFLDADILLLDDIAKLFAMKDDKYAVMVSKNEEHRFEWASVMLFNCAKCKMLTPEYIEEAPGLHTITWVDQNLIGDLGPSWNHLVGYSEPSADVKLLHYTQGMPAYPLTQDSDYALEWAKEHQYMNSIHPWEELMGTSVHATVIDGKVMPKYKAKNYAKQNVGSAI